MQPSLTDSLRQVLDAAQQHARQHRQDFVGSEYLLLALIQSTRTQAATLLQREHVPLEKLIAALDKQLAGSGEATHIDGTLPLSPKAQRSFNNSIVMAQSLRENRVSTRHLLMSLLNESSNSFLTALRRIGGDPESLTRALAQPPSEPET